MDSIINGLNDAQRIAVTSPSSVLQVLAPPGSGKTKTLTSRVAHLIHHNGINPCNIIVCTFTVKAAKDMQERIEGFLGKDVSSRLKLGTFHSIARRFLSTYGKRIGISDNFGIADTSDSKAIITRIVKKLNLTISPGAVRSRISKLKADGITADRFFAEARANSKPGVDLQELAQVYVEYGDQLKLSTILDYDDLLLRCAELLRKYPECVSRVEAILVDEFQDTNHIQYDLMNLFAQQKKAISTVGDPDQSIYGWRSAKIENLRRMQIEYPETHVVNLEENYRSSSCILLAAQELIEQDKCRHQKCLAPTHSAGEPPTLRRLSSAVEEAAWIVSEIFRVHALTGGLLSWDDFAVLLRSAALSRLIEKELANAGIPYCMVGGSRFYDRVEIKLVLDYLRVVDNTSHSEALARVINVPSRKVGEKTVEKLVEEADRRKESLWAVTLKIARGNLTTPTYLSSQALKGLASFVNIVLRAQAKLNDHSEQSLTDFVRWLIEKLELHAYLRTKYPLQEDYSTRWSNIQELIAQTSENPEAEDVIDPDLEYGGYEPEQVADQHLSRLEELRMFLSNVTLSSDNKQSEDQRTDPQGSVTLSTMHAAKGLEWPVVFIPAASNGTIPHSRSEDADEERRLLYVAMTRAQCLLSISCPSKDSRNGKVELSSFLSPNDVRAKHVIRGPTVSYDLVREMAKILRREDRSLDIERGRATLRHLEDDQFAHCVDEATDNNDSNSHDLDVVQTSISASGKRSRNDGAGWQRSVKRQDRRVSSTITTTTTMQHKASYSICHATHSNVAFVSASTLSASEKENQPPAPKETKKTARALANRKMSPAEGQQSISHFFGGATFIDPNKVITPDAAEGPIRPAARPSIGVGLSHPLQIHTHSPTTGTASGWRRRQASTTSAFRSPVVGAAATGRKTLGVRRSVESDWNMSKLRHAG